MDRKMLALAALMCVLLASGCIGQSQPDVTRNAVSAQPSNASGVQKVEILHFHGTYQCYSCITVGKYAEETVNAYFSEEVKAGKIFFAHINGELPENREMVTRYGATGSSLWIGVYSDNGFHKEENINVWYKIDNRDGYMNYLGGIIEKRLAGDMG